MSKEAMQDIPVSLTAEQVSQLKEYGYQMIKLIDVDGQYVVRVTSPYQFWKLIGEIC